VTFIIHLAYPARNRTIIRQGLIYLVAHQRKLIVSHLMGKEFGHLFKRFIAIEVVGINDAEWFVDLITCRKHGMGGTPWLGTLNLFVDTKRCKVVTLVHIVRLNLPG